MTKQLWQCPKNTFVTINGVEYFFHHIDGMFSYCEDKNGNVIHFSASTPVEVPDAQAA